MTVDRAIAGLLLVLAAPLLLVIAVIIVLEDGRPVLFRQPRAGRHGRPFQVVKLRTMRVNDLAPEEMGQVLGTHPLVTRAGRVLRRLKLDELPQLINVVAGEMRLVGPRPALPSDVAGYDVFAVRRLEVPPGMTGWAQVNGSVSLSWPDRILLDVWYVDHRSVRLDLAILARTLGVVTRGERVRPDALAEARAHAASLGHDVTAPEGTPPG